VIQTILVRNMMSMFEVGNLTSQIISKISQVWSLNTYISAEDSYYSIKKS